jgi:hypothetical protein
MTIPFLACMASVAAVYHLPPRMVPSIQAVEGGRPGLVHGNTDGSQDLDVMQVNTPGVQPLAGQTGVTPAVAVTHRRRPSLLRVALWLVPGQDLPGLLAFARRATQANHGFTREADAALHCGCGADQHNLVAHSGTRGGVWLTG